MALGIVIGLLYTPYMIRMLGPNEYGLYSTVSSTISMLTILNLGLNAGYIRYFSIYKVNNDTVSIDKLNGLYLIIFFIIASIALVCGLFLGFNLNLIFGNGLTPEEYETAKILAFLTTFNLAEGFIGSVFATIITAHERFVFLKTLAMIRSALTPAVMLPILYLGYKSIVMVSVTVVLSLLVDLGYFIYCQNILKVKYCFMDFEKGILRSLFAYTFFIALNGIIDQIGWNADKCILARFNGTTVVAVYSVAYSLYMFYQNLVVSLSGVFTPRIHSIVNQYKSDNVVLSKELTNLFIKIGRIQYFIVALVVSGFYFFGKYFVRLWVGAGYENSYIITIIFMIFASIPLIQNLGIEIQRALNKHQFRSVIYCFTTICHLIISVLLCQKYSAIGCAIGNAIALFIGPVIAINIYYHKKCYINIIAFWQNIIQMSIGLILPVICMVFTKNYISFDTIPNFAFGVIIYTMLYCISMWFFSLNSYEKNLILLGKA